MRLYNKKYDFEIELEENAINHLIIEAPNCMSEMIQGMLEQTEGADGDFCLMDKDALLPFSKAACVIVNPFALDCNDKKILSKIYKELEDDIRTGHLNELADINAKIVQFLDNIFVSNSNSLVSDSDMLIQGLLKLYNVKVNTLPANLLERIMDYVRTTSEVLGYSFFVFVNVNHYMTIEECSALYEFCMYRKLRVLNISGCDYNVESNHHKLIFDNAMCLIEV